MSRLELSAPCRTETAAHPPLHEGKDRYFMTTTARIIRPTCTTRANLPLSNSKLSLGLLPIPPIGHRNVAAPTAPSAAFCNAFPHRSLVAAHTFTILYAARNTISLSPRSFRACLLSSLRDLALRSPPNVHLYTVHSSPIFPSPTSGSNRAAELPPPVGETYHTHIAPPGKSAPSASAALQLTLLCTAAH